MLVFFNLGCVRVCFFAPLAAAVVVDVLATTGVFLDETVSA